MAKKTILLGFVLLVFGMATGAFAMTVQYWDYEDYDKYEYYVDAWEGNGTGFIGGFLIGVEDGNPDNYRNVQIRFGGNETPRPTTWEIIPASEATLGGIQTPVGSLSNGCADWPDIEIPAKNWP